MKLIAMKLKKLYTRYNIPGTYTFLLYQYNIYYIPNTFTPSIDLSNYLVQTYYQTPYLSGHTLY